MLKIAYRDIKGLVHIEVLMNHAKVSKMQRKFGKQQCVI